jgi:hypothetical protein
MAAVNGESSEVDKLKNGVNGLHRMAYEILHG